MSHATCPRPELIPALERLTRRRCAQVRTELLAELAKEGDAQR